MRRMTLIVAMNALASTSGGVGAANTLLRLGVAAAKSFSEICESQSASSSLELGPSGPTRAVVSATAGNFFTTKNVSPKTASNSFAPNTLGQVVSATLIPAISVPIPVSVPTELSIPTSILSGFFDTASSNLAIDPAGVPSRSGDAQGGADPAPLPAHELGVSVPTDQAVGLTRAIGSTQTIASAQIAGYIPTQKPSASADFTQCETLASMSASTMVAALPQTPEGMRPTGATIAAEPQSVRAVFQGPNWIAQTTSSPGVSLENTPFTEPGPDSSEAQAMAKSQPSDQMALATDPAKQETGETQSASSDRISNEGAPQASSIGTTVPDVQPARQSSNVVPDLPVPGKNTAAIAALPKRAIAGSKSRFEATRSAKDGTATETISDWAPSAENFKGSTSVVPDPARIATVLLDDSGTSSSTSSKNKTIGLKAAKPVDAGALSPVNTADNIATSSSTATEGSPQQSQHKAPADPKNQGTVNGSLDASSTPAPAVVTSSSNHDPKSASALTPDLPTQKPAPNDSSASSDVDFGQTSSQPLPTTATASPVQLAQVMTKASQSEMRIGLNTQAFGNVEVRTVVHASEVGVSIGSEKGDLRSLLANDLPGIANTLQQQNLRLTQVSFQQQGFTASSDSSSGGNAQSRSFATGRDSTGVVRAELRAEDSEQTFEARSNRGLSVLA